MINAAAAIAPTTPGQPGKGASPAGGDLFALSMLTVGTGDAITAAADPGLPATTDATRQSLAAPGTPAPPADAMAVDAALAWLPAVNIPVPEPLPVPAPVAAPTTTAAPLPTHSDATQPQPAVSRAPVASLPQPVTPDRAVRDHAVVPVLTPDATQGKTPQVATPTPLAPLVAADEPPLPVPVQGQTETPAQRPHAAAVTPQTAMRVQEPAKDTPPPAVPQDVPIPIDGPITAPKPKPAPPATGPVIVEMAPMEPDILVDDAATTLPDTAPALPRRPLTSRPALAPRVAAPAAPEAAPTDAPVTDDIDPVEDKRAETPVAAPAAAIAMPLPDAAHIPAPQPMQPAVTPEPPVTTAAKASRTATTIAAPATPAPATAVASTAPVTDPVAPALQTPRQRSERPEPQTTAPAPVPIETAQPTVGSTPMATLAVPTDTATTASKPAEQATIAPAPRQARSARTPVQTPAAEPQIAAAVVDTVVPAQTAAADAAVPTQAAPARARSAPSTDIPVQVDRLQPNAPAPGPTVQSAAGSADTSLPLPTAPTTPPVATAVVQDRTTPAPAADRPVAPSGVAATPVAPDAAPAPGPTTTPIIAVAAPVTVAPAQPAEPPRPSFIREVTGGTRQTVALRPQAAAVRQPVAGTTAPAAEVFGAAIHAAASRDDREPLQPTAPLLAVQAPVAPTQAAPVADTARPTLDMTRGDWPNTMIDHIERLRDAADAQDTRIRLVPDALGGIAVSVKSVGDAIHVRFTADHAETRALIEDAAPKLAQIAEDRGVRIGQTIVETAAAQQQQAGSQSGNPSNGQSSNQSQASQNQAPASSQQQTTAQTQAQTGQQQPRPQHQPSTARTPASANRAPSRDTDAAADGRVA